MAMFMDRHAVASEKQAHAPSPDVWAEAWQKRRFFRDMTLLYTRFPGQTDSRWMMVPSKQTSQSGSGASIHE